jgi:ABC-type Fe3+-hydroxamate transport system substrate-binding protein
MGYQQTFRTGSILLIVVIALFDVGCSSQRPVRGGPVTRSVTDDLGKTVKIPVPLNRAVSLAPSLTEMVFAAGAGDRLVGVTSYCNFPADAAAIKKVGDTQTPNIESIVALRPQIVLVSTSSQLESFMSVMEQQNIAVYVLDVRGIEDVSRGLRSLGVIFGTRDASEAAATDFERRVYAAAAQLFAAEPPRVFLQISNEPLFTIGKDSFLTRLIERAGGISVTKDLPSGYPKLSKETAMAMNPDIIILSDSEDNREPNDVFRNSPAVKNSRVYRINADILSRPGPRLADALEKISGYLKE